MGARSLVFAPHEIVGAFVEHAKPPRQDQLDALKVKGASKWALAGAPDAGEWNICFARIRPEAENRFDFADDGAPAVVVIALDSFAEPIDIVASTLRGGWIGGWLGRAALLGAQHLLAPRIDEALPVFPTLMDWLRGERQGLVLVDPARAAREMRDAGPFLAVGGFDHAAQLVTLLTAPPPKVVIRDPETERRAA